MSDLDHVELLEQFDSLQSAYNESRATFVKARHEYCFFGKTPILYFQRQSILKEHGFEHFERLAPSPIDSSLPLMEQIRAQERALFTDEQWTIIDVEEAKQLHLVYHARLVAENQMLCDELAITRFFLDNRATIQSLKQELLERCACTPAFHTCFRVFAFDVGSTSDANGEPLIHRWLCNLALEPYPHADGAGIWGGPQGCWYPPESAVIEDKLGIAEVLLHVYLCAQNDPNLVSTHSGKTLIDIAVELASSKLVVQLLTTGARRPRNFSRPCNGGRIAHLLYVCSSTERKPSNSFAFEVETARKDVAKACFGWYKILARRIVVALANYPALVLLMILDIVASNWSAAWNNEWDCIAWIPTHTRYGIVCMIKHHQS